MEVIRRATTPNSAGASRTLSVQRSKSLKSRSEDLEAAESPVYPDYAQIVDGGRFRIGLPSTVFTAFMVSYLNTQSRSKTQIFALLVAITLQVSISFYLHQSVTEVQGDLSPMCSETSFWLQCMTLIVFVMTWLNDTIETIHIGMWLFMIQTKPQGEPLITQRMRDKRDKVPVRDTAGGKERDADDDGTEHVHIVRPQSAISWWAKVWFYLLGIGPKVVVSCLVLICGAGAILRAGSEFDLVLNTVAASFLLEIDDVLYKVLFSTRAKFSCSGVPEFGWTREETRESCLYWITEQRRAIFSCVTTLTLVFALRYGYWCTALAPETPITYLFKDSDAAGGE